MKITIKEDRSLTFDKILQFEQCRKELLQAYPELARISWTLEFLDEDDKEYYQIDTMEDYEIFVEARESEKTLQARVKVSSDIKELDSCSLSSIQPEKKQQGEKEESQFGNGPFEPIAEEDSKKVQPDHVPEKSMEKYARSIKTQPTEAKQGNSGILFTKNKERQEVNVEEEKEVRQFHEKIEIVNEYSRSNEPKGNYSKESVVAQRNDNSIRERSELKKGKSVQSQKMRQTNRNDKLIDQRQQEQLHHTCSFCRKSTPHLYYLRGFHKIRLCQSCDKHYQIKSAKSIQPSPLLCNFCGTSHGTMFQVGNFDLFSCTSCSRVWEISVKDEPVMGGSSMKINRYE